MQNKFSVVIVCKNEEDTISRVLESVQPVADEIVVYDNGSIDSTLKIVSMYEVNLHKGEWLGYGKTKQQAVLLAKHDWVLSIDADEALDNTLQQELKSISLHDDFVYRIKFKNFLGSKYLKWGEWGGDNHIRLFNRKYVNWNDASIHEELSIPSNIKVKKLEGYINHYTIKDIPEYTHKVVHYALLNASKYFEQKKRATWIKRYINPPFSFLKNYFFRLGFLDGWEGLVTARMSFFYTSLKYTRLHELWQQAEKKEKEK